LIQWSADREIARNALLEARQPDRYKYDVTAFEEFVEQMVGFCATAQEITEEEAAAAFQTDYCDGPPRRCAIPKTQDYKRDKPLLFLDKLHDTGEEQYDEITPFFILRSVYLAFFWKPKLAGVSNSSGHRPRTPAPDMLEVGSEMEANRQQRQTEEERQRQVEQEQRRQVEEERARQERLVQLAAEQERQRQAEEERQRRIEERQRQAKEERQRQVEELQRQAEEKQQKQIEERKQRLEYE
jgi:flagellar biosynthesis GTPase FlhF